MKFNIANATANGIAVFGQPIRGRACGSCKFCCIAVPVALPEGPKPSGVKCRHLCSKGCGIYETRPMPCEAWSCRWLYDPLTANLRRPDQTGYCIDPMPQEVLIDKSPATVLQIWVDRNRPEAHRDPALRAYLIAMWHKHKCFGIVRWDQVGAMDQQEAMILIPPEASGDGEWIEKTSAMLGEEAMAQLMASTRR